MKRRAHASSIFSQSLDRALMVVYLLGAVVPLLALAYVVQTHVLPNVEETYTTATLLGVVLSIGALSLGSFFILRRLTRTALQRMEEDKRHLSELLKVSRSLAQAAHAAEVVDITARCALDMTGASAVLVLGAGKDGEEPVVRSAAGNDARACYERLVPELGEAVDRALEWGESALATGGSGSARFSAAVVPVAGRDGSEAAIVAVRDGGGEAFTPGEVDGLTTLAGQAAVSIRNGALHDAQRNFFTHVTELLVAALDAHLDRQEGHGQRTAEYANRIGRSLGLEDARLERLHFASLLHDIGMLKIDRPQHHSREVCRKHPTLGARMLQRIRLWEDLAPFVQNHHEWYDGSGYPDGVMGDDIPLEARILAVADSFDAMTSDTSYKRAMSALEAARELRSGAGTQFDPEVVDAMLALLEQGAIDLPGGR